MFQGQNEGFRGVKGPVLSFKNLLLLICYCYVKQHENFIQCFIFNETPKLCSYKVTLPNDIPFCKPEPNKLKILLIIHSGASQNN